MAPSTTLGGLSVREWLERPEAAPAAAPQIVATAPAGPARPAARQAPSRRRWPVIVCALLAMAVGAYVALALPSGGFHCPPAGEGATYCHVQHDLLRTLTTFVVVAALVGALMRAFVKLPGLVARSGRRELLPSAPTPTRVSDPLLRAACGGYSYRSSRRVAFFVWRPRWERA
jgi:hypothetical protein